MYFYTFFPYFFFFSVHFARSLVRFVRFFFSLLFLIRCICVNSLNTRYTIHYYIYSTRKKAIHKTNCIHMRRIYISVYKHIAYTEYTSKPSSQAACSLCSAMFTVRHRTHSPTRNKIWLYNVFLNNKMKFSKTKINFWK